MARPSSRSAACAKSTTLLCALGHQLLYGAFALGSGTLVYVARLRGDAGAAEALGWTCGFFLVCLAGSLWKARRRQRRVRRGASDQKLMSMDHEEQRVYLEDQLGHTVPFQQKQPGKSIFLAE